MKARALAAGTRWMAIGVALCSFARNAGAEPEQESPGRDDPPQAPWYADPLDDGEPESNASQPGPATIIHQVALDGASTDAPLENPIADADGAPDMLEDDWVQPMNPPDVAAHVDRALADERMHFCNDPKHVLYRGERPLCAFADAAKERCPALPEICARPASSDRAGGGAGFGSAGNSGSSRGVRKWFQDEDRQYQLTLPQGLGQALQVLFWMFAAVVIAVVVYLVVSNLVFGKREESDESQASPDADNRDIDAPVGLSEEVERDVQRLLERAQTAARAGHVEAALRDVHAALLRYLEALALIRLHRSKTNGDHVRALSAHPELQGVLRDVSSDLERVQFGKSRASSERVLRLLGQVTHLVSRAAVSMAVVGSGWLFSGCEEVPKGRGSTDNWGVTADVSAAGFSILAGLLEAQGRAVSNHVGSVEHIDEDVQTLVVYDQTDLNGDDWQSLEKWASEGEGRSLVIAGEYDGALHFDVDFDGPECSTESALTEHYLGPRTAQPPFYADPPTLALVAPIHTLTVPSETNPLITCDGAPLVSRKRVGLGEAIFLSNADLLANASLAARDNASIVLGVLSGHGAVKFAGTMAGAGTESPYEALADARLAPFLWQGLLFLLVLYMAQGIAFRPLRDPEPDRRQQFVRHVHALGRAYARGKAASFALSNYATWAIDRLKERLRPGTRPSLSELADAVAKRTGRPPNDVLAVLAEAATRKGTQTGSREQDLQTLRKLEKLVMETKGTR